MRQEQLVVDLTKDRFVLRIENITLRVFDHHAHGIAHAAQLIAVVEKVANVRLRLRNHLFERSEEHTSELQSLMRISYAVLCLKKKTTLCRTQTYHTILI